jgi:hypothetical protein
MIGSFGSGVPSELAGAASVLSAAGVCAPFPGAFITDAASYSSGKESVPTAAQPPACGGDVVIFYQRTFPGGSFNTPPIPAEVTSPDAINTLITDIPFASWPAVNLRMTITGLGSSQEDSSGAMLYSLLAQVCPGAFSPPNVIARMYSNPVQASNIFLPPPPVQPCTFYDDPTSTPPANAFVIFMNPAVAASLYVCSAYDFASNNNRRSVLTNFTVTIEAA